MTKTILALLGAAVMFTACEQKQTAADIPPPAAPTLPEPEKLTQPPEPPKPAPTPEPVVVAPPPAKPTIGSIVWAIARISITTDDGIIGVAPGSKLRVVKETETGYTVTDEKHEFQVTAGQVTLNSGTASSVLAADAAARAAYQSAQTAAKTGSASAAYTSQAIGEMQNRYDVLAREVAQLENSLVRAHQEEVAAGLAAAQRRVYTKSIHPSQVAAWRARLSVVQVEKDKAFWELKRAKR